MGQEEILGYQPSGDDAAMIHPPNVGSSVQPPKGERQPCHDDPPSSPPFPPPPRRVLVGTDILAAQDLRTEEVAVPEWGIGAVVFVRGLTGQERDEWENAILKRRIDDDGTYHMEANFTNTRATLLVRALVDEQGNRLFDGSEAVGKLGKKSAAVLDRLFGVAQRLSRLSTADVKELEKNSGGTVSGGSSTS